MKKYVIISSTAKTPSKFGKYKRVAVVEMDERCPHPPRMISERAVGVKQIIQTWEDLNVGKTKNCAYQRAMVEARSLVEKLERESQA